MYCKSKSKSKKYKLTAITLCFIILLLTLPFVQMTFAEPTTNVPIINDALTTDTTKPVVLINGSSQVGYETLAAAMNAIGSNDGDYTIVFVQDYNMVVNTDMNATNSNATGENVSLSITSTFASASNPDVSQTKTFSMQGSNTTGYNFFFNADTTIHDCVFDVYGSSCSHMFGNCNNFTIGNNVVVNNKGSNGRIQLYGGGDSNVGTVTDRASTNLVINSGTFAYAMAGNRNGVFTGDAKITVQGTAVVTNLCACSQTANCFGAGSTSKVYANGEDGAFCATLRAGLNASGLAATDTIDVYLNNVKSQDNTGKNNFASIILNTGNPSISNVYVEGDCQICTQITATNLTVNDNSVIRNGNNSDGTGNASATGFTGVMSLTGNLTLGDNSKYIHAGVGTQSISKDIAVNGSGAEIQFYKNNATTAPVKMTVGGSYSNTANTLDLSIWKDVGVAKGDVFLTYSNAANADETNYNKYLPIVGQDAFEVGKDGANIICSLEYTFPTYYVQTDIRDLYYYTEVGNSTNSDGGSRTVYRKYVYNSVSGKYEVFNADENGNYSGSPLNQVEEHPQPNAEYRCDFVATKGTMVRFDEFGKYRINAAVGTNASGYASNATGTACGNHISFYNIDNKGTNSLNSDNTYESNASWANLVQSDEACSIAKAYLVMTTPLRGNAGTQENQIESNLINNPMKLMYGDDVMLSNGYLPEGFIIGKAGSNDAALSSDVPTLLYDNLGSSSGLGEAMTITDVTDFVKAHGYGRYYGVDIPYEGADVDSTIAWRLIVLEKDSSMEYIRKSSLQMGPISNGNFSINEAATVTLNLDGLTTPDAADEEGFSGQLLMIGSDNTTDSRAGGGTGSNLHNSFYPDPINKPDEFVQIASNDPSTPLIDRPLGHWSQGLMDVNGVNLTSDQVSHTEETNGAMGIDVSLLTVTNTKNTDWANSGGHNLYLTPSSPAIMLTSQADPDRRIGYIDVLGISTDVSLPKFDSDIWHTDICTTPAVGTDIIAGHSVIVKGTAKNITPTISAVQGSFNTIAVVNVDKKLSDIRDLNDENQGEITATFHYFDRELNKYIEIPVLGVYDESQNTITFDFGVEFLNIPLYNKKDDWIEFEFKADTDTTPTIDDPNVKYVNTLGVWGQTIYQNNEVIQTPFERYVYDEDIFNTYINQISIAKIVTGDYADPNQEFSFTVTISNLSGGHYAEGTEIAYKGGVVEGITAEAPADGKLTVNSNGEVTFKLKHGQYIHFVDILGKINIKETPVDEYIMSWENVLLKDDGNDIKQNVGYGGETGDVSIGENESREINIFNNKNMPPDAGVSIPNIFVIIILSLFALFGIMLIMIIQKQKRRRFR